MVSLQHRPRRASLHTLGCRLNQSETRLLEERLQAAGYEVVPFGETAELGIINTCTVTAQAELKCRYEIRRFLRKNPRAFLAVTGCYAESGHRVLATMPGVDLILGNQNKLSLPDYLGDGSKNSVPVVIRDRLTREDFTIEAAGDWPFAQRANLKVQDGCDFVCGFCIIPRVRGPARSRDWSDLLAEARQLARRGVRELVLTGVNIGTYSSGGYNLVDMVDALADMPGLARVRISSIEPTTVDAALFQRMADPAHNLQPYLHLPLQSGCDRVLREMRRRYSTSEYADFVRQAMAWVPDLCLGTDVLVGHPGETPDDFEATCRYFQALPFAYAHVFTYSERERTPAARRTDSVPMAERQRRSAHLRQLSAQRRLDWNRQYLGRTLPVLFEDPRDGFCPGYTANYIRVMVPAPAAGRDLRNTLRYVRLDNAIGDFVEGTLLPDHTSAQVVLSA
ncbi:MAG: tRNA (N(6)-L-threonylcarbamoyladenosine(37)-C(2))-methylthiotransferase MtaB [Opitutales bacterium]